MKRRSFTLIECVLAIAVVSVGVAGIAGMWGTSLRANRIAAEETRAVMLARDKLAEVCLGDVSAVGESSGRFGPPNERFRWTVRTAEVTGSDLLEAMVTVAWSDRQGERSVCTCLVFANR